MAVKILFVDDDTRILSAFKRRLYRKYKLDVASSAELGLRMVQQNGPYAVIISDQNMPGVLGTEFLKEVSDISPLTTRIMLTGNADRQTAIEAVNESQVFRYYTKPCALEELENGIEEGVRQHEILSTERRNMEQTITGSINLLVEILSANDPGSFRQTSQLRKVGQRMAKFMEHPNPWELDLTILLSSIGEVMLPPELKSKLATHQSLNETEQKLVTDSPGVARHLLLNIPRMKDIANAIYYKDRGFDGSGYPDDEVCGDDIPLNARLLRVLTHLVGPGEEMPTIESFERIRDASKSLDAKLLDVARRCFLDDAPPELKQAEELSVTIRELAENDRLLDDLRTVEGEIALTAGNDITKLQAQKIQQFHQLKPLEEPVRILRRTENIAGNKTAA